MWRVNKIFTGNFLITIAIGTLLVFSSVSLIRNDNNYSNGDDSSSEYNRELVIETGASNAPQVNDFSIDAVVEETSKNNIDSNKKIWLNSGAYFISTGGIAKTVQNKLPENDPWRLLYAKNNPRDTDFGFYPQNIFRLVTIGLWDNLKQEGYFRIVKDNKSNSEYRNDSNGLLFFNRYQDGDNLYYTGIRVDGFAVIKKKIKGKYFTLAYNQIYPGKYDREKNPNLLPHGEWIGLRSEVKDIDDNSVSVKLFIDRERNGNWELVAEAIDEGKKYGKKPFFEAGHGGIRTDFMDVEFDDYRIEELK
ncbi:MAG: hypothetical protein WAT81_01250 [Candidatus Moraniibacteriota bacterium]